MTAPIPAGQDGLIPHLVCSPCAEALAFYAKAFGAEEVHRMVAPDGARIMHAAMRIDGRFLFLGDDFPEYCDGKSRTPLALGATPVTIHRYVADCDAAVARAAAAGGTVAMGPVDTFWGDRYAIVVDPFGHSWSLATHLRDMTPDEMIAAAKAAFAQGC